MSACRRVLPAAVLGSTLLTAGCGSPAGPVATPGAAVQVVAAENFWGDITAQIGGSHVQVTSIITDPNTDPHSYETDASDAAAISGADFAIVNGAGYDDLASKLLGASSGSGRVVLTMAAAVGAGGADVNPHLWYDPTFVRTGARAIEADLARLDPVDTSSFKAGLAAFDRSYQPYLDTIASIRASYAGTKIGYTERVPGYLVQAAGLVLGTPAGFAQSVEDGDEPTPQDEADFTADLTGHTIRVLLDNAQVTDAVTAAIRKAAAAAGVPVVGMAETIPAGFATFQAWQVAQAQALLSALGG